MPEITCSGCGDTAFQAASTKDGSYRGVYHTCYTSGCPFFNTVIAVTIPTLCEHGERSRVPGSHREYCDHCGRLERDWDKGYAATTAPWDQ